MKKVLFKSEGFDEEANEPFGPVYVVECVRASEMHSFDAESEVVEDLGWLRKSVGREIAAERGLPFEADDEEMMKVPEVVEALKLFDAHFKPQSDEKA